MVWMGMTQVQITGTGFARLASREDHYSVPKEVVLTHIGDLDQPDLMARAALIDGAPVITQLSITSKPKGSPVRNTHLDDLSMDKLALRAMLEMATQIEQTDAKMFRLTRVGKQETDTWQVVGALDEVQKTRPRNTSPALLAQVAEIYTKHLDRAPTQAVATTLGLSQRTAARRVKQAEDAGLLPSTTQGKKRGS